MSFNDDCPIPDNYSLLRRISKDKNFIHFDQKLKRYRPSSGAFNPTENTDTGFVGVSCDLLDLMEKNNVNAVEELKKKFPDYYLVKLNVGELRKLGIEVKHTPLDENKYHCDFVYKNETKPIKKRIAKEIAHWVIGPNDDAQE